MGLLTCCARVLCSLAAPAVAAAIHDATGAWLDDLPMTPERVLAAIRAAESARTSEPLVAASP